MKTSLLCSCGARSNENGSLYLKWHFYSVYSKFLESCVYTRPTNMRHTAQCVLIIPCAHALSTATIDVSRLHRGPWRTAHTTDKKAQNDSILASAYQNGTLPP